MLEALKKFVDRLFCHRSLYGALALTYGSACFGVDKQTVYQMAFAVYLAFAARG
ncbi:MAG: hypothetical protein AB8B51_09735 [Sedimentitalea sp.]